MGQWDYDDFAKSEGFRSGKHRDDFYSGRERETDGCAAAVLVPVLAVVLLVLGVRRST